MLFQAWTLETGMWTLETGIWTLETGCVCFKWGAVQKNRKAIISIAVAFYVWIINPKPFGSGFGNPEQRKFQAWTLETGIWTLETGAVDA